MRAPWITPKQPTTLDPMEVLHRLAKSGTWTRKRCLRTLRRVLDVLVANGWARRNDNRRYRITSAGFDALENGR